MNIDLKIEERKALGKKVKSLRKAGYIPAVIYGSRMKALPVQVKYEKFAACYRIAKESQVINLLLGKKKIEALVYDVQKEPVKDRFIHVDFRKVSERKKVAATVPVKFIGEAPAVKHKGGVLVENIRELEVRALAHNLPPEIKVDLSSLENIHDDILVSDLKLPSGIELLTEPNLVLVTVVPPKKAEKGIEREETAAAAADAEAVSETENHKDEMKSVSDEAPKQ